MKNILLVFIGGGIGSILRYCINGALPRVLIAFPLGILLVNVLACLLIGVISCLALTKTYINQSVVLLVSTGICGGLSTFSAFSNDNYTLYSNKAFVLLLANIVISVVMCFGATLLGFSIAKRF